jgi:glutathione S-transferase
MSESPSVVIHHLEWSRSIRVVWLLEELGVPYQLRSYARDPKTSLAPKALRAVHPLGKAPVVEDEGRVYAESGAILEHLAERYGPTDLVPPSQTPEREACRYWLHYAEGSLMPLLLLKIVFQKLKEPPVPLPLRPLTATLGKVFDRQYLDEQLERHASYIDEHLADRRWFAGEQLTLGDIQMSFPLQAGSERSEILGKKPNIADYVRAVHDRPAYRRALQRLRGGTA